MSQNLSWKLIRNRTSQEFQKLVCLRKYIQYHLAILSFEKLHKHIFNKTLHYRYEKITLWFILITIWNSVSTSCFASIWFQLSCILFFLHPLLEPLQIQPPVLKLYHSHHQSGSDTALSRHILKTFKDRYFTSFQVTCSDDISPML